MAKPEPHPDNKIELTVVVSGQPVRITVNPHQGVAQLIHESLQKSGNQGQGPGQWELRTESGALIDQSQTIGSAGISDGMTLFLNPITGAGG